MFSSILGMLYVGKTLEVHDSYTVRLLPINKTLIGPVGTMVLIVTVMLAGLETLPFVSLIVYRAMALPVLPALGLKVTTPVLVFKVNVPFSVESY
jgi:hypothetical protein